MLRQNVEKNEQQTQFFQDLQFMLSSIRARENGLIFFIEGIFKLTTFHLSMTQIHRLRSQYQQKQKIYSRQINIILLKHVHSEYNIMTTVNKQIFLIIFAYSTIKTFWIKLKTIIKVSIQRIKSMNFIDIQKNKQFTKFYQYYDLIITLITKLSQTEKGIQFYKQIQNMIKKRNLQAILLVGDIGSPKSMFSMSQTKIQKNRSERLLKNVKNNQMNVAVIGFLQQKQDQIHLDSRSNGEKRYFNEFQNLNLQNNNNGLDNIEEQGQEQLRGSKIKSLNRIKNRKNENIIKSNILNLVKVQQYNKLKTNSSKASQKYIKKIHRQTAQYERNFQSIIEAKYDISCLDKKKNIFENIYALYDELFAKNIANHKIITKFMYNNTKINKMLYNQYQKKRKIHEKLEKNQKINKKIKDKQKQKNKSAIFTHIGSSDKKQKQKQKQKQRPRKQQDQSRIQRKHRKLFTAKQKSHHFSQNLQHNQNSQKQKLYKQSDITSINSTNNKKHSNDSHMISLNNQINQKNEQKQKQKQKQKKVIRSKTAKFKIQENHMHIVQNVKSIQNTNNNMIVINSNINNEGKIMHIHLHGKVKKNNINAQHKEKGFNKHVLSAV